MHYLNRLSTRWGIVSLVIIGVAITAFGVAAAIDIPSANGVIHACYKSNGDLRVVNKAADCNGNETHLKWSQDGPAGPQGQPDLRAQRVLKDRPDPPDRRALPERPVLRVPLDPKARRDLSDRLVRAAERVRRDR